jgi:hypothetical protein
MPTSNINTNKRRRSTTPNRESLPCSILAPATRYALVRINGHHFGLDNKLVFMVTWHEPGSSDTLEPFANVQHLDVLVEYEKRLEACCKTSGAKGANRAKAIHYKYLLQKNKEQLDGGSRALPGRDSCSTCSGYFSPLHHRGR